MPQFVFPPYAGVADHLAENEQHALSLARSAVASLNAPPHPLAGQGPWRGGSGLAGAGAAAAAAGGWEEPRFSPEELRGGQGLAISNSMSCFFWFISL